MDITYLGKGSVKVSGKQITIVSDPDGAKKTSADVILTTSPDVKVSAGDAMLIDGPGEYEVKNSLITGVATQLHVDEEGTNRGTSYVADVDGVSVGILGNVAPKLSSDQIEVLSGVDVLVVPVGGHGLTLDATAATEVVSQIEPKFVIPVHYEDGSSYPMPQDKVDKFLGEMGGAKPEPTTKFKVTDKDIPLETTLVLLEVAK